MRKRGFCLTVLFFCIVNIFFIGGAFAGSITWTCPVCHETFSFDPRDSAYRNSFAQQHLASHKSAQSSGSFGSLGFGSTGDPVLDIAMPFFAQVCQSIGRETAQGIFGTPSDQQQIDAQIAALRAQQEAAAREEARLREERHQQLLASLKVLPGSGSALALKTLDNSPGSLKPKGISDGSAAESFSALDELTHAAFFMNKAATAGSQEEAALYSEQAFRAAEGEKINVNIPEVGLGKAVTEADANAYLKIKMEIDKRRKEYMDISDKLAVKHYQYDTFKKARTVVSDKVKQQEEKVKSFSGNASDAQKAAEDQKLAEARKLLDEANQHVNKAEKDLKELQKESEKLSSQLAEKKKEEAGFLTGLGKR